MKTIEEAITEHLSDRDVLEQSEVQEIVLACKDSTLFTGCEWDWDFSGLPEERKSHIRDHADTVALEWINETHGAVWFTPLFKRPVGYFGGNAAKTSAAELSPKAVRDLVESCAILPEKFEAVAPDLRITAVRPIGLEGLLFRSDRLIECSDQIRDLLFALPVAFQSRHGASVFKAINDRDGRRWGTPLDADMLMSLGQASGWVHKGTNPIHATALPNFKVLSEPRTVVGMAFKDLTEIAMGTGPSKTHRSASLDILSRSDTWPDSSIFLTNKDGALGILVSLPEGLVIFSSTPRDNGEASSTPEEILAAGWDVVRGD